MKVPPSRAHIGSKRQAEKCEMGQWIRVANARVWVEEIKPEVHLATRILVEGLPEKRVSRPAQASPHAAAQDAYDDLAPSLR